MASRQEPPGGVGRGEPIVPSEPATVDLHTHTLRSDGKLSPAALVAAAYDAGIRLLSITDHDNLAAVREVRGALPPGLELIAGVEINAVLAPGEGGDTGELHVLGLGVDVDDEAFEATLAGQREERRVRFERMLAGLRAQGVDLSAELETLPPVTDEDSLGRPRLARAMMARGLATSIDDAFERWLSPGRPAYVARVGLSPVEAIRAIVGAGGLAALAHVADAEERLAEIQELRAAGLRGLEVHHRSFDLPTVTSVAKVAGALRLIPTGGSDYHGDHGTYAEAHAGLWVPAAIGVAVRSALETAVPVPAP